MLSSINFFKIHFDDHDKHDIIHFHNKTSTYEKS